MLLLQQLPQGPFMNQNSFAADRRLILALERLSHPIHYDDGRILFSQGDAPTGLYIVERGKAELVMISEAGKVVMRLHAGAGSLLGLPAIIGNKPYSLTAVAGKGSEVRFVPRDGFEDMLQAEPSLYPYVLQVFAAEVRAARNALLES
jgi:CRP-like cAMP-binding protein